MKIVQIDNFDRENVSEELVAESVPPHYAELILRFLCDEYATDYGPYYYRLESDDYELYKFEP